MTEAKPLTAGTAVGGAHQEAAAPRLPMSHSLPRYLIIGVLSFAVDAGTLYAAHGVLRIWLPLATTVAYAAAFTVNFSLNRLWAFRSTVKVGGQVARYLTLTGVNYVLTVVIVTGLAAAGLHYLLAKMSAAMVIAMINYVAYRTWVFR